MPALFRCACSACGGVAACATAGVECTRCEYCDMSRADGVDSGLGAETAGRPAKAEERRRASGLNSMRFDGDRRDSAEASAVAACSKESRETPSEEAEEATATAASAVSAAAAAAATGTDEESGAGAVACVGTELGAGWDGAGAALAATTRAAAGSASVLAPSAATTDDEDLGVNGDDGAAGVLEPEALALTRAVPARLPAPTTTPPPSAAAARSSAPAGEAWSGWCDCRRERRFEPRFEPALSIARSLSCCSGLAAPDLDLEEVPPSTSRSGSRREERREDRRDSGGDPAPPSA